MTDSITTKYQKLTQVEHILKRPGMYIGSVDSRKEEMWIFYHSNDKHINATGNRPWTTFLFPLFHVNVYFNPQQTLQYVIEK